MISQRTSAGLQAAKERGVKLGNQAQADANKAAAATRQAGLMPILATLSHLSSRDAAAELGKLGHKVSHKLVQRMRARS